MIPWHLVDISAIQYPDLRQKFVKLASKNLIYTSRNLLKLLFGSILQVQEERNLRKQQKEEVISDWFILRQRYLRL